MENSPNDITYDRNSPIRLKVITNRKLCEGQDLVYRLGRVIDDYMDYYNNYRYQWNLSKMTPVQYRNHLVS